MKEIPLILAFLIFCLPPSLSAGEEGGYREGIKDRVKAHHEQQNQENKAFHQSLRQSEMDNSQKAVAVKKHQQTQYSENAAFREQLYKERVTYVQGNDKLTDEQKQAVLQHVETQYRENVDFGAQQHQGNLNFIDELAGRTDLSPEQRKAEIRKHRETQEQKNQQHRQTQSEENLAFRQSVRE